MPYIGDLLGKPYQDGGRGDSGYDCYGLLIEVQKRFGNILPDFDYKEINIHDIIKQVEELVSDNKMKKVSYYEPGAIIVFRNAFGFATHVAVYMGNGMIIHATDKGVKMTPIVQKEDKIVGVYLWQK